MDAFVVDASGRAICLLCHKKILKGQKQIVVKHHFFHVSGRIHRNPEDCTLGGEKNE